MDDGRSTGARVTHSIFHAIACLICGARTHMNMVPEIGRVKCTTALPGGRARTRAAISSPSKDDPDFPPKMIDPHAVRAHPPAWRCGTRRINERGKWIPSVHIRIQSQSRRRERVRAKLEKKRPRGEGGRGAREAKPVKNKPLGKVHGRPRGMTKR
ncbi:hypothetical protein B0H14DRAFT_2734085, partial [Mycena olivaceomarginata]